MITDTALSIIGEIQSSRSTLKGFLDAATIWINKPHVVNKRLCGTKILQIKTAESLDTVKAQISSIRKHNSVDLEQNLKEKINNLEVDLKENDGMFVIVIREVLPKQIKKCPSLIEAVVYDVASRNITFYPLHYTSLQDNSDLTGINDVSTEIIYRFTYLEKDGQNSSIQLECCAVPEQTCPPTGHVQVSAQWLLDVLTPKIKHWAEQSSLTTAVRSLRLVELDSYHKLYTTLKSQYGPELIKNWTETTNPEKFVYEDIGIAAYLLLLWESDRQKTGQNQKQSFVDLGCGNGLLVYILSKEGHPGLGIDVRKRNIWEQYGSAVRLEERPITPSADNLFPDFDWIIGNHSDELTPWIPVVAARSSYTCSYFVLPCCLHDFSHRFNGKIKGESHYRSYLTYIGSIGLACGFEVEEDTLRIPSTKRICQIGRSRTYPAHQEELADEQRQKFINKRCAPCCRESTENPMRDLSDSRTSVGCDNLTLKRLAGEQNAAGNQETVSQNKQTAVWTENFQPRSSKEIIRNCQSVSQQTKNHLVQAVFKAILAADNAKEVLGQEGQMWRKGGSVDLSKVAQMLDPVMREELKSECGGVQTLLRNHHNIFQVSGGKVQLRDFSVDNPWSQYKRAKSRKTDPASVFKTSSCWFYNNHPDGCPRSAGNCCFAHGEAELRPKESREKSTVSL